MGSHDTIPYWHVNVPEDKRTTECPEFLRQLSQKDLGIISTLDSEYHIITWEQLTEIIKTNHLERLKRAPSELRRYLAYTHGLAKKHGSVGKFIISERLRWSEPIAPRGDPFEYDDDIKILFNDWPYGIDPRIIHIVVWTKFDLEEDPATGDLSDKARAEIDDFVTKTFRSSVPDDRVLWFKNWRALKSVGAVEHFHVMLYNPDPAFVRQVTNGDIPQCQLFV